MDDIFLLLKSEPLRHILTYALLDRSTAPPRARPLKSDVLLGFTTKSIRAARCDGTAPSMKMEIVDHSVFTRRSETGEPVAISNERILLSEASDGWECTAITAWGALSSADQSTLVAVKLAFRDDVIFLRPGGGVDVQIGSSAHARRWLQTSADTTRVVHEWTRRSSLET